MRFFTMEQDKGISDMIAFRDFDICGQRYRFTKKEAESINDSTTLYLAEKSGEAAPDFIQSPIHMVSDVVRKVLDMYEDDMVFKSIALVDKERERILMYYTLLLEEMDMLSDESEFYPNGSEKRLVLDSEKIGEHKVFMLADKRFRNPFVSLEVVESLLRRNVCGIRWNEVEVR